MHNLIRAEFLGTPVSIIDHLGRRWLAARDVGRCLGYAEAEAANSINRLFSRHADEFGAEDTCTVKLTDQVQAREVRIFSQTGCILLAMFANTARAKDFRAWAKRALASIAEGEAGQACEPPRSVRVSRAIERQAMEMYVAGLATGSIARHLGISQAAVKKMLSGSYRFSPAAGVDETTPELLAAVVAERARRERERVVQCFIASAANIALQNGLEALGHRLLAAFETAEG